MKKLIAVLAAIVVAAGLGACSPIGLTNNPHLTCADGDRYLKVIVRAFDTGETANVAAILPVTLTVKAESPVPNYGGVLFVGVGVNHINPEILEETTPFTGIACWPGENPVALLLRATFIPTQSLQKFECILRDGNNPDPDSVISSDSIQAGAADLIPGAAPMQVQCVDYYLPGSYSGPPLPTFNPLGQ